MRTATAIMAGIGLALVAACTPLQHNNASSSQSRMSDTSVKAGERLYNMHCYQCHAMGTGGLGPSLNDKPLPRFLIRMQIRYGFGVMPEFGENELSDRQVEDIIDYVVALRQQGTKK